MISCNAHPSRIVPNPISAPYGSVAEWFKALVLKTSVGGTPPWVRIPPLPPVIKCFPYISRHCVGLAIRGPHLGPHGAGASLMGGHEDHRNRADFINILPPHIKNPGLYRPHPGVPPLEAQGTPQAYVYYPRRTTGTSRRSELVSRGGACPLDVVLQFSQFPELLGANLTQRARLPAMHRPRFSAPCPACGCSRPCRGPSVG